MELIDKKMDLFGGQPSRKSKKSADTAKDFYKLGRITANIEQEKKEIGQMNLLNMLQQNMIHQSKLELERILTEVALRQQMLDQQMQMMAAPPPLPGVAPQGAPPPLPLGEEMPPEAMGGPMPQDMGTGIPVDQVLAQQEAGPMGPPPGPPPGPPEAMPGGPAPGGPAGIPMSGIAMPPF